MTGETDEFPLSRVWGRFSGCGDTPTAGSQDPGLLEGGQLCPCALGPTPRLGGKGHGREIGWRSEDFGSAGSRSEGKKMRALGRSSEELALRLPAIPLI